MIKELIVQGYEVKQTCEKDTKLGIIISGEEYATWLMTCSQVLLNKFPDNQLTHNFVNKSKNANGNLEKTFNDLMGILKSFEGLENNDDHEKKDKLPIDMILDSIFMHFSRFAKSLESRHDSRETIKIKDEYDVQDLLEGVLWLFVDDVRPEVCTPMYAGGNSRIDFYLPEYNMYIETKMTRKGLKDKKIGEELLVDIGRYKDSCDTLICFIYDADNQLSNPHGLIKDLEAMSQNDLKVKVYINPLL